MSRIFAEKSRCSRKSSRTFFLWVMSRRMIIPRGPSNFGTNVDIAAPGGDVRASSANGVLSTWNTGTTTPGSDTYAYFQGTSQATPHVAGTVALMLSLNANLTPDQVEAILKSTARPFPSNCNQCGAGIVDAFAASEAAFNAR